MILIADSDNRQLFSLIVALEKTARVVEKDSTILNQETAALPELFKLISPETSKEVSDNLYQFFDALPDFGYQDGAKVDILERTYEFTFQLRKCLGEEPDDLEDLVALEFPDSNDLLAYWVVDKDAVDLSGFDWDELCVQFKFPALEFQGEMRFTTKTLFLMFRKLLKIYEFLTQKIMDICKVFVSFELDPDMIPMALALTQYMGYFDNYILQLLSGQAESSLSNLERIYEESKLKDIFSQYGEDLKKV